MSNALALSVITLAVGTSHFLKITQWENLYSSNPCFTEGALIDAKKKGKKVDKRRQDLISKYVKSNQIILFRSKIDSFQERICNIIAKRILTRGVDTQCIWFSSFAESFRSTCINMKAYYTTAFSPSNFVKFDLKHPVKL